MVGGLAAVQAVASPSMADSSTQSIVVAAAPEAVAAVLVDFPSYSDWVSAVSRTEILEEYEDGYASKVRFVLDAGVLKDDYTLAYEYADDLTVMSWRLVAPSQVQKSQWGSYEFGDNADGTTTVTYTLSVELTIPLLGMFRRKAEKMIMDSALRDLKKRVEEQ